MLPLVCCDLLLSGTIKQLPRPETISHASDKACKASQFFWEAFHGNDYARIDEVLAALAAADAECPDDPILTWLLAASNTWKFLERGRAHLTAEQVKVHAVASLHLCQKAEKLDPSRRIIPSFTELGKVVVGHLDGNAALLEEGFQGLRRLTREDPKLQGFVQGWVFSALWCENHPCWNDNIESQFATIDSCTGFRAPRMFPRIGPVLYNYVGHRAARHGDPYCYNNDIVPHNMEGAFLALGDTYLKKGQITQARMAYKSIERCPNYPSFVYKDVVATRLANLEVLRDKFRTDTGKFDVCEPAMFFQSSYACTACHATLGR
jgi:hypothetical protein